MKFKILTVMAVAILWWVQRGQAKTTPSLTRKSRTASAAGGPQQK